jgi:DnaJ family protein B protein 12
MNYGFQNGRNHIHRTQRRNYEDGNGLAWLQILPLLMLLLLSYLSTSSIGESVYQLQRSSKYNIERSTFRYKIPYWVRSDFNSKYAKDANTLKEIEEDVEDRWIQYMKRECQYEQAEKHRAMKYAEQYGDERTKARVQQKQLHSCEQLQSKGIRVG